MLKSSSLRRWFRRAAVLCVGLAVLVCVVMYGSAWLYQRDVERLSERIKGLRVGVSTYEDAQALTRDYRSNVVFEHDGCASEKCAFAIRLRNTRFPAFYDAPLAWRAGIRPTYSAAVLRIDNGKLRYAYFGISTRTQFGYWLEASFSAAPALSMYDKCRDIFLGRDSTYAVRGGHLTNGDGGGWSVRTAFGVQASPEERRKATTFNFSCIIARPSCKHTGDLMPEAQRNLLFEPDRDESFKPECEDYVKKIEVGPGPWAVESAFEADPISIETWVLTR